jgi:signal transduction histidine kinase
MRLLTFLSLAILFLAGTAQEQTSNDTAAIIEVRAAFNIISQKPDSALAIAEKALLQSQRSGNKRLAANAYKTGGWAWLHKGIYNKVFPDLLHAAQIFKELRDTLEEMYMYVNLGIAYSNHSEFTASAKYLFMADSLTRVINDTRVKAEVNRQMGILYREQGQYKKALPYFRESMEMARSAKDTLLFFDAASSLCIVYIAMSTPDSSLKLLQECASLMGAMQGRNYQKAMLQERYGDVYFALSDFDKAMKSYDSAYKIFDGDNNKADMAYEAMNMGKTLARTKKYHEAESYLSLGYRLSDSLNITSYAHDAADQLSNLYKTTGEWRKAYYWLDKMRTLQDSLHLAEQAEKTSQWQAQYETEKKDEEIALLKKDQELSHALMQKQKAFQEGGFVALALLLLIGLLAVNRYRIVQKSRRMIELEKMRNHIARDLHDDIGSTLSSINIISKVALEKPEERQKVSEHLKKIHESSGFMLENMSDIVWMINPVNDTLEKVFFKMNEFAADIFEPLNIQYEFNQAGNFHNVRLGLQARRDLYLVFKEVANNAAKYSGCTKVTVAISENDRQIEMQVKDNGMGFDRDSVKNGNGLRNMEERARHINGALTISGGPGEGTVVTLKLKPHD